MKDIARELLNPEPIAFQDWLSDCPIDSLLAIKTVQCLCVGQENANRSKLTSDEKRRLIQEVQKHPVIINVHPGVPVSPLSDNNISYRSSYCRSPQGVTLSQKLLQLPSKQRTEGTSPTSTVLGILGRLFGGQV